MPESAQRYHILPCEELPALLAFLARLLLPITLSSSKQMPLFPPSWQARCKALVLRWDLKTDL